jgi:hypothetical protein
MPRWTSRLDQRRVGMHLPASLPACIAFLIVSRHNPTETAKHVTRSRHGRKYDERRAGAHQAEARQAERHEDRCLIGSCCASRGQIVQRIAAKVRVHVSSLFFLALRLSHLTSHLPIRCKSAFACIHLHFLPCVTPPLPYFPLTGSLQKRSSSFASVFTSSKLQFTLTGSLQLCACISFIITPTTSCLNFTFLLISHSPNAQRTGEGEGAHEVQDGAGQRPVRVARPGVLAYL